MTQKNSSLIGRNTELGQVRACLQAKRNVLLEGPVGVGKTRLALAVTEELGLPVFRVDGDSRYSEQKLSGWFDPPTVIKKGFSKEAFLPGPLVDAMQKGGVLFINELNRLPEGVQNVLLPAIDERVITVPRLGEIRAKESFLVIATQNPKEFVATSHLSEAILDRFELVVLDYQSEEDELQIVQDHLTLSGPLTQEALLLPLAAVRLARMTRNHPRVRRGASVRAALSVADIAKVLMQGAKSGGSFKGKAKPHGKPNAKPSPTPSFRDAFLTAVLLALPTRIEMERDADSDRSQRAEIEALLKEWSEQVVEQLQEKSNEAQKKK